MITVQQLPDGVLVNVASHHGSTFADGNRLYQRDERLFGKEAGDVAEGVYDDSGKFVSTFAEYDPLEHDK